MKKTLWLWLLAGCAAGPRPIPPGTSAVDRLHAMEEVLTKATKLSGTFELSSQGENAGTFKGSLTLLEENKLKLTAEGSFKGEYAYVELDSRDGAITRTSTRGPKATTFRDLPAPKLREAVALGLSRMGLMHNLVVLSGGESVEKREGGFDAWVKAGEVRPGGVSDVDGVKCTRVDFTVLVEGRSMGDASLCIGDGTGLPLERTSTIHFPTGDMTLTEKFTWAK